MIERANKAGHIESVQGFLSGFHDEVRPPTTEFLRFIGERPAATIVLSNEDVRVSVFVQ